MPRNASLFFLSFSVMVLGLAAGALRAATPPVPTPRRPVTDEYHGVKVVDDYQWLENWNDPEVKAWSEQENNYARAFLDRLPQRPAIKQRLEDYYTHSSPAYFDLEYRGGWLFARKQQPPKNQLLLVALKSAHDLGSEHAVVDPNELDKSGNLAIDWYVPSLDGQRVAVAMSVGGSEDSSLYFFESATGKQVDEVIPHVNFATAGGSAAWNADSSGVYYTRYPQPGECPDEDAHFYQQVYFHKLGTPVAQDTYVIGKDFPRIAEIQLQTRGQGQHLLVTVANGDGGQFEHFVLAPDGQWTQLTRFDDQVVEAVLGEDNALYLLSRAHAPRGKILRLPLTDLRLAAAKTIVPAGEIAVVSNGTGGGETLALTAHRLYAIGINGGPSVVSVYTLGGKPVGTVPLLPVSSVSRMVPLTGDEVLFDNESYLTPQAWFAYSGGKVRRTALATTSPINFNDAEVVREFAISKDGTRVPLNIIRRKGAKLDGANPAWLYGYGGYGISLIPRYLGINGRMWLDAGGVLAYANLRGGGEYGEEWHQAGRLTKKQNVFDDFVACARHLILRRYTSSAHLAIEGGSNGGLLMGAALTQHPELFRAVVSHVGIYDMLRVELDPNGAFNTTEYGSVKNEAQFQALYAYSPYHHVRPAVAYPAVLFMTGANDSRVNPAHSRKMTAALQAATASGLPVLLRTSSNSGHGFGTALSEQIEQAADRAAFLFDQLGMNKPVHGRQ